jgi:hypothetical protein
MVYLNYDLARKETQLINAVKKDIRDKREISQLMIEAVKSI